MECQRESTNTSLGSVLASDGAMEPEINNSIFKFSKNIDALCPLIKDTNIL